MVYFILNSLEKFHAITARIVEMSTKVTGRYSVHFSDLVPPQHTITVTYYCRTACIHERVPTLRGAYVRKADVGVQTVK